MDLIGIYISMFLFLFILLIISLRISIYLARRALCTVVTTFRDFNALQYQNALPLESMGLGPRPLLSFRLLRDYKPWAVQTLVRTGIIRMGVEGTFYLSEETLNANPEIQAACRIKL